MIRSDRLPKFVFVAEDGSEQHLTPGMRGGRVRAIADRIEAALGEDRPPNVAVGLMFPSGPDLVLAWLACLMAGVQPLVMQYPTAKQSRQYWEGSVTHTLRLAGVRLVLCDSQCAERGLGGLVPILDQATLDGLADGDASPFAVADFAVIQLSSGTTGHRKAVRLRGAALLRHAADYNAVLGLSSADRIVSWLPLYHDMGYVACFIMPLLLGVDVVMMDPMVWVRRPALLADAIAFHRGSICYMPNFGFEVMAREVRCALPSVRTWISCSEPVSPATARRFLAAVGAPPDRFAACYAMAENVFAVSFARGIATRQIDGVEVMSCGAPIPGVEIALKEGEIWVRSPVSLRTYVGGDDIRDEAGFYPTGDLGELADGALYVTGRRQDLLIQAGRKFMLSDIDLAVNRLFPDVRGRAATLALHDARLGTELPLVLIEAADFFERTDQADIAGAVCSEMGLDQLEVAFVPPRFLTKTSSGKFNRTLSAAHWSAVLRHRAARTEPRSDRLGELRASFPRVARDQPVGEVLDSLSLTVLRIILSGAAFAYDPAMSLREMEARLQAAEDGPPPQTQAAGLRIVSLADRHTISRLGERHIAALSARLGCPVSLEHVCLPPSPVILSDLIFTDYFLPRLDADAAASFTSVQSALDRLRGASLILVDDGAELRLPPNQAYGVLSHNLERDPRADLITVRWQHYARQHHLLPLTYVSGRDLPLDERDACLARLQAYLGCPVFRIASYTGLAPFTRDWDFHGFPGNDAAPASDGQVQPGRLMAAIGDWVEAQAPARVALRTGAALEMLDLGHFCSHFADQASIDTLLGAYGSFCIAGQDSSIPYIRAALDRLGKRHVTVPSYAPKILATLDRPYDCLLICGAWGDFPIGTPAAAIMFIANSAARTINIDDAKLSALIFRRSATFDPPSAADWFYPGRLHRDWPVDVWSAQRAEKGRTAPRNGRAMREVNQLSALGDTQAAYDAALYALDLAPDDVRALIALGKSARALKRLEEARDWAQRAVDLAPANPVAHRLLIIIAIDQNDLEAAYEACARAEALVVEDAAEFGNLRERLRRRTAPKDRKPRDAALLA